ncbi:MAG: peptide chain release factor 3 [Acidobacteriota bacterium]
MSADAVRLEREIARRRTFAIVSHPDAGKTTLTEKLLLLGGAVQTAGAVKARRSQVHATSDWMEIEKQRGISTTTSVMTFDYRGHRLNLLDTPGHADFSEDTYRTLAAVDAAVLLVDAAKGVEAQTKKLFKVCAERELPTFLFVNKMDRFGRAPLEVLDEVESVLGIRTTAVNWPVGAGPRFRGVFDRRRRLFHTYADTDHGQKVGTVTVGQVDDPSFIEHVGDEEHAELVESLELLDVAGEALDEQQVLAGKLAPSFFGSALTNFGVDLLLDAVIDLAPPPSGALTDELELPASDPRFTGLIFKIQANMNPKHRDRLAFLRVVSGRYEPGLSVTLTPRGKKARLSEARSVMASKRETATEAFPGDVVGLFDPGLYRVGDTVTTDANIHLPGMPFFPPEQFAVARVHDFGKRKAFQKGLDQLAEEGAIQVFEDVSRGGRDPVLAAVGQLQFDVFSFRLESEYGVTVKLEPRDYVAARWILSEFEEGELPEGIGWGRVCVSRSATILNCGSLEGQEFSSLRLPAGAPYRTKSD